MLLIPADNGLVHWKTQCGTNAVVIVSQQGPVHRERTGWAVLTITAGDVPGEGTQASLIFSQKKKKM